MSTISTISSKNGDFNFLEVDEMRHFFCSKKDILYSILYDLHFMKWLVW